MPYLGSTVFVSTLVVVCLLSLTGCWLLVRSLAPGFHARAQRACTEHLGWTTLLGAVLAAGGVLVCGALVAAGPGIVKAIGFAATTLLASAAIAGSAGLVTRVGAGLRSRTNEGSEWHQTLRGALVVVTAFLAPVVGWFLLLPLAIACGLGAAFTSVASGFAARVGSSAGPAAARRSVAPHPDPLPIRGEGDWSRVGSPRGLEA